jgi:GxxExxY protein
MADEAYPLAELTDAIIAAAIEVHKTLGPGFIEKIYENALLIELRLRGHQLERQISTKVAYKGHKVGEHRLDLLVDQQVVVDLKSVEALAAVHAAQLRSTLKAFGKQVGLLLNFNQATLANGIKRVIFSG